LVLAAPLAVATSLLSVEEVFDLPGSFMAIALAVGAVVVAALLAVGLHGLRAADSRTRAAVERAASAEAIQRSRADELARVLRASEGLALRGEGHVDYLGVLSAITPKRATSFLVRTDADDGVTVVAAHGPLATSLVGIHRAPAGEAPDIYRAPLASFSASGHHVGAEVPLGHFSGFESDIQAGLAIRLVDHGGHQMGFLHMLDPIAERVLEPSFVGLAQLVATQIAVAMENDVLMARLRQELSANQRIGQQLLQASKMGAVGELAAAVAHEVNNPLTGILGFAELLLSEIPADDPRHDEVTVIRDEAVRARTIVKALLEFARPRPPQRIPASVNDLARSTLELIRFRARNIDVKIEETYADIPSLELDPDAVKQVLLNLFNNALDAMPGGGTLRLATEQIGDGVRVAVTDSGVGMDEETRRRIFTPFFSTRLAGGDGTGLGLSVSRQIVESHGGTIEVESTPGHGATFTVWLPASFEEFAGAVLVPSTSTERAHGTEARGGSAPDASIGRSPGSSDAAA
jgi:signal transduction histidine kinase